MLRREIGLTPAKTRLTNAETLIIDDDYIVIVDD